MEKIKTLERGIEFEQKEKNEVYTVTELQEVLSCEHDKALKVMSLMFRYRYSMKLGKSYITTRENLFKFLDDNMGSKINL